MKKRWKYFIGEDSPIYYKSKAETHYISESIKYYKILQELTWRFYFRFMKAHNGWFTPCNKCQEYIDEKYEENPFREIFKNVNWEVFRFYLCKECVKEADTKVSKAEEVIFGNSDYEPLVELSRTWLDNDDEIHDVTKEEYEKERPYKYL